MSTFTFDVMKADADAAFAAAGLTDIDVRQTGVHPTWRTDYEDRAVEFYGKDCTAPFATIYAVTKEVDDPLFRNRKRQMTRWELETYKAIHNYPHEPDDVEPVTIGVYGSWCEALTEAVLLSHRWAIDVALENVGIDRMLAEESL